MWAPFCRRLSFKIAILKEQRASTNGLRKGAQTHSNSTLFPSPGAPGQPPLKSKISRAKTTVQTTTAATTAAIAKTDARVQLLFELFECC